MAKTRRKNLWFRDSIAEDFDACLKQLRELLDPKLEPNEIANAALTVFLKMSLDDKLRLVGEGRTYDIDRARARLGKSAAAGLEDAASRAEQAREGKLPKRRTV